VDPTDGSSSTTTFHGSVVHEKSSDYESEHGSDYDEENDTDVDRISDADEEDDWRYKKELEVPY